MSRISLISIGKSFFRALLNGHRTGAQNGAESALRKRVGYFGE
jgi:hypothetical protein